MASTVIAVCNQKGGVGKTTTVISLGSALVERGRKVLLIDLDPQGSLSISCGIDTASLPHAVYDVLCGKAAMGDILYEAGSLDVAPANIDLAAAELELVNTMYREEVLRTALESLRGNYDYIFIDCSPSLGLLTVNAMVAADKLLIPVECEYLALRGLGILYETYERVRQYNKGLEILGILPCLYDRRLLHAREVIAAIRELYPGWVLNPIRRSIRFAEAPLTGRSILEYANVPGAEDYRKLAEVIDHG